MGKPQSLQAYWVSETLDPADASQAANPMLGLAAGDRAKTKPKGQTPAGQTHSRLEAHPEQGAPNTAQVSETEVFAAAAEDAELGIIDEGSAEALQAEDDDGLISQQGQGLHHSAAKGSTDVGVQAEAPPHQPADLDSGQLLTARGLEGDAEGPAFAGSAASGGGSGQPSASLPRRLAAASASGSDRHRSREHSKDLPKNQNRSSKGTEPADTNEGALHLLTAQER